MEFFKLLLRDPLIFSLLVIPLLYSIILHEIAHGYVALKMGDPTAKLLGRLSLNPLRHLDPVGSIMLLVFGFGWAKPVPVDFRNIANQRRGIIYVSAAGIVVNIFLAFCAVLVMRITSPGNEFLSYLAWVNIMLASFNLIPIPPLDGSKVLMGFLPASARNSLARIEPFGFFIIIGLLYVGALNPVIGFFRGLIIFIIGLFIPG